MKTTALVITALCLITVSAYTIPDPEIQLLTPRGLRVSIPDESGVQLFSFNGHVNRNISINDSGSISGEVYRSTSGKWVFVDSRTNIQKRDVLHYWLYVQVNGSPYKKTGSWTISSKVNPSCPPSATTTSQKGTICRNQLLLEDNFDSLNSSIWSREILIPSQPHYEFCVYHNHPESAEIRDGILHVIPSLLDDSYGEGATARGTIVLAQRLITRWDFNRGNYSLYYRLVALFSTSTSSGRCTSTVSSECNRTAVAWNILPPAISARLTTEKTFSFRYGRIEIRAKFPEGDWLYPELWLLPKNPSGTSGLENVRIRLGMARGNRVLTKDTKDYGGRYLEFGLRGGSVPNSWDREVQKLRTPQGSWTTDFHVYSTTWNVDGFVFHVDGEEVGRLNPGSNGWLNNNTNKKMAPFDEQFYIALGVGVGGVRDFPDNTRSGDNPGYAKPWRNVASKAMLQFWQAKNQWFQSWRSPSVQNSNLQIDYVRVWAI